MRIDLSESDYNFLINLLKTNYKIQQIIERMNENPKDFGNIKDMTLTINQIKELDKDKLLYLIKVFESVRK